MACSRAISAVLPLTATFFIISSCDSLVSFRASSELLMLCDVEVPSRCILRAEAAIMRQRRNRLGIREETLKTRPERIENTSSSLTTAILQKAHGINRVSFGGEPT